MPEMIRVRHGRDAHGAGRKDFEQQPVRVIEFTRELVEQSVVIITASLVGLRELGLVVQRTSDVNDDALATKLAFHHSLPVAAKAFVAGADIKEMTAMNEDQGMQFAKRGQSIFQKRGSQLIFSLPVYLHVR